MVSGRKEKARRAELKVRKGFRRIDKEELAGEQVVSSGEERGLECMERMLLAGRTAWSELDLCGWESHRKP